MTVEQINTVIDIMRNFTFFHLSSQCYKITQSRHNRNDIGRGQCKRIFNDATAILNSIAKDHSL